MGKTAHFVYKGPIFTRANSIYVAQEVKKLHSGYSGAHLWAPLVLDTLVHDVHTSTMA